MAYAFPEIEYTIYSKTFLKDVRLEFEFSCQKSDTIVTSDISRFFSNSFNLNDITTEDIEKGFFVLSEDEQIKFDFDIEKVSVMMKCPTYKSFDLALSLVKVVKEYLDVLNVSTVSKITISKFDELEFKNNKNYTILNVMKNVFHNNLMNSINDKDNLFKGLVRWEKVLSFDGDDATNSNLFIEFGFSLRGTERQQGFLTLKTQIWSGKSVEITEIETVLQDYNRIVDNAFHWCIRPEIINMMKVS